MQISFTPLTPRHFPLLLRWLQMPHVQRWWDQDVQWTEDQIKAKYISYTMGYKISAGQKKPLNAFVIEADKHPIGYIQCYSTLDFLAETVYLPETLPESLASLDFYIGETDYLGRKLGQKILTIFLEQHVFTHFKHCLVDPQTNNQTAISAYQKAGFHILTNARSLAVTLMIAHRDHTEPC